VAGQLFIGLMSGTSMDGIDAALVRIDARRVELLASHAHPWPEGLQRDIRSIAHRGQAGLDQLGQVDAGAGEAFAGAVQVLLAQAGVSAEQIAAIGSHGQTLCHGPRATHPYTLQIGDPNRIVERTGITTVADFRRRDIAAGGQGAPLVPAFHQALLRSAEEDRVVLNIGGIANVTLLPADPEEPVSGYDTGPGNCLMDAWSELHRQQRYDDRGAWAATGQAHEQLLHTLLADPYFSEPPPKSTGTEYFSLTWLERHIRQQLPAEDVQASLCELTTRSIADAIKRDLPDTSRVLVCGGGARNEELMRRLQAALPGADVQSTAPLGLEPDWVEAMAFAWLAQQTLAGRAGNIPSVTGAGHPVVLGAIYPA
jgi:anhydro-N-acetylmuramic acid kinase